MLQTFYQRMDLSGEYTVDQDGAISLPRLGSFMVEGRRLSEVQAELAAAFSRIRLGAPRTSIRRLTKGRPVYVVGPVKTPGAYKHVPA